jgi:hypothetical protein
MNHQVIMQALKLGVICVSLLLPLLVTGQDLTEKKWKLGLNISPNFSYQQRSNQRNRAIKMSPFMGVDFGLSLSRIWKDNFIQFSPSVGYTRNKTKSSLAFEDFNVTYLFGGSENRFQSTLLYGKIIPINEKTSFQFNLGINSGVGIFKNSFFQDANYVNKEERIRKYYVCLSTGAGITKRFKMFEFYWGIQLNQGLLSYTRVYISINQYQTNFLSKGSSVNIVGIIYLKKGKQAHNNK